jgi:vitamin B12 transporter
MSSIVARFFFLVYYNILRGGIGYLRRTNVKKALVVLSVVAMLGVIFGQRYTAQAEVSVEERKTFLLYFEEKDLVVSPTRSQKPMSMVAENVTVITASDIELMNAHTLAEVLSSTVGIQLELTPSPGFPSPIHIQGSEPRQVRVVLDGVTINNLSDNFADLSAIPVQNIERIEIIKGPASSAWGSSSGGVINIITKSPAKNPQETLSASYGERNTSDLRTELTGSKGIVGYYLSLGRLQSNGFRENMGAEIYNAYGKIALDVSNTNIQFIFSQDKGRRGFGLFPEENLEFNNRYLNTYFALNAVSKISENITLNAFANHRRADFNTTFNSLSDGTEVARSNFLDTVNELGSKLTISSGLNSLVAGVDYDKGTLKSNNINGGEQSREEWAVYSNYTLSLDRLSITPGVRYDHTNTNGNFWSPSLGATYSINDSTLLRALVSRGFSTPPLTATFGTGVFFVPNPQLTMEKVLSYQTGIETRALKYLLLKGTLFRHDVSNAITPESLPDGTFTEVNIDKIRRQGVELEARSDPFYHTSIMAGFSYDDITDRITGNTVPGTAKYSLDLGILYDYESTKALLRAHYIKWNINESYTAKNGNMVIDINVQRAIFKSAGTKADLFLTLHNIFGTDQYLLNTQQNPGIWFEGGIRVTFF